MPKPAPPLDPPCYCHQCGEQFIAGQSPCPRCGAEVRPVVLNLDDAAQYSASGRTKALVLAAAFLGWMFDFYDLILYTFLTRLISAKLGGSVHLR